MGVSNDYVGFEPHYHSDSEEPLLGRIIPNEPVSILDPFADPPCACPSLNSQTPGMGLLPNYMFQERSSQTGQSSDDSYWRKTYEQREAETEQTGDKQHRWGSLWHGAGLQLMPVDGSASPFESSSGESTPRKTSIPGSSASTPRRMSIPQALTATPSTTQPKETSSRRARPTTISFDSNIKKERYPVEIEEQALGDQHSRTIESIYSPPEKSTALPPGQRTPCPKIPDPEAAVKDYFTVDSKTTAAPELPDAQSSKVECQAACPTLCPKPIAQIPTPLLSKNSGYLERFMPNKSDPEVGYVATPPQPIPKKTGIKRSWLGINSGIKDATMTAETRPINIRPTGIDGDVADR